MQYISVLIGKIKIYHNDQINSMLGFLTKKNIFAGDYTHER